MPEITLTPITTETLPHHNKKIKALFHLPHLVPSLITHTDLNNNHHYYLKIIPLTPSIHKFPCGAQCFSFPYRHMISAHLHWHTHGDTNKHEDTNVSVLTQCMYFIICNRAYSSTYIHRKHAWCTSINKYFTHTRAHAHANTHSTYVQGYGHARTHKRAQWQQTFKYLKGTRLSSYICKWMLTQSSALNIMQQKHTDVTSTTRQLNTKESLTPHLQYITLNYLLRATQYSKQHNKTQEKHHNATLHQNKTQRIYYTPPNQHSIDSKCKT